MLKAARTLFCAVAPLSRARALGRPSRSTGTSRWARAGGSLRLFSTSEPGWIARCKERGVQDLVSGAGFTTNGRFDQCAQSLRVVSVDEESGDVVATISVEERVCNSYGTLHGGVAATLVDIIGTMCCLAKDHTRAGVSVEINVSYASAAKEGAELELRGRMREFSREGI